MMSWRSEDLLGGLRRPLTDPGPSGTGSGRRPQAQFVAGETRRFVQRAVHDMVDDGLRQFVALGPGLSALALRSLVRRVDPSAGVASARHSPMTIALRQALLGDQEAREQAAREQAGQEEAPREGVFAAAEEPAFDLLAPDRLVEAAERDGVDLARPVGLLLIGSLHLVPDDDAHAHDGLRRLVREVAPGSVLMISHLTGDYPSSWLGATVRAYERLGLRTRLRSRTEVGQFFTGLDLWAPGVELVSQWRRRPEEGPASPPDRVASWGALGRVR